MIEHDLHVHTVLSACCHDEQATPEAIVRRAAAAGLKTVGFADHLWDAAVDGASDWYRPQDLAHLLQIRRMLPADTRGVRVLVGCETEYLGGGVVGISPETAAELDFVLLPVTHFHMRGYVVPEGLSDPRDLADLMAERFADGVESGLATGIAHPFLPCGHCDRADVILGCISDGTFADCFGRAAERGVSIEVHVGMFPSLRAVPEGGFSDETFLRVLTLARRAGCVFHFASDAHCLDGIGGVRDLEPFVRQIGITDGDVHPLVRPV